VSFLKNARNGTEPRFIGVSTKEGLMDVSLLHPAKEAGRNFRLQDIRMKDFLLHDQVHISTIGSHIICFSVILFVLSQYKSYFMILV
jgi:hypothetical protein